MYEDMTFETILESMFSRMPEMDSREGSIAYDSVAAVAYSLEEMYFMLENYKDLVFADTSAGEYLDRFAASMNVERKAAVNAVKYGSFDKEIPIGSRFSTIGDSALIYKATAFTGEKDGTYTYLLECETAGDAGNAYYGDIIPVEHISGIGKAVLGEVAAAGADRETDESLRERLLRKIRRPSTSGNVNDYYNWAMGCSGVGAAKIFPLDKGPGTVGVVIVDDDKMAASEALVQSVADYIETVRPIGADVTVESAAEKAVNISAKVRLSSGALLGNVQSAFQEAVQSYLQDNAFSVSYISLARIGNILMGISGVEDYTDLLLNGAAENVAVADKEVAVTGAVRLEVAVNGS